jgi:predicted TPR repeat methyltransferase
MNPIVSIAESLQGAQKLLSQGSTTEAKAAVEEILAVEPDHIEARHLLGIALHQLGEFERADAILGETLARQPGNAAWWTNFGNVLTAQNKLKRAELAFAQVTQLTPGQANAWANLGSVLQRQNLPSDAEMAYRESIRIDPRFILGLRLLGNLLQQQGHSMEGGRFLARALVLEAKPGESPLLVAKAWLILDQPDKAAEVYARLMRDEPNHPTAAFLYAACTGLGVPKRCDKEYIEATFNHYASAFDTAQTTLAYRGPEMLQELLGEIDLPAEQLRVLDLGCGTGRCADVLKPRASSLTGVDLSEKMLDHAAERRLYDELVREEIITYLKGRPASFDLLISAECLIYFGELHDVFTAMAVAIPLGGVSIFTIETPVGSTAPYALHSMGRYCHSRAYVESVAAANGFKIIKINDGTLRMELGLPIHGSIWAIRKSVD